MSENKIMQTTSKGRVLQGTVIKASMQKTVVVYIERRVEHPLYKKIITRSTKLLVHDEEGKCKVGDKVVIKESRPISKFKSWVLVTILEK